MKKVLFFAALMLCVNFVTNAQTDEPKIQFGVRAGLNISNFGGDAGDSWDKEDGRGFTKSLAGFHVGVIMDINVAQSFYIQPGLYITSKGAKAKEEGHDEGEYWSDKITARPLYLQLPVLASYRINLTDNAKWHVNVGPYVAVGLSGKVKYTLEDDGDKETEKINMFKDTTIDDYEYKAEFNRFDAGLTFGTGVSIDKFYVGVAYDLGLANIYKDNESNKKPNGDRYTARNRTFMISLGYNF